MSRTLASLIVSVVVVGLAGCGAKTAASLRKGDRVGITFAQGASGLDIARIAAEGENEADEAEGENNDNDDGDKDDVECENGVDPAGNPCADGPDGDEMEIVDTGRSSEARALLGLAIVGSVDGARLFGHYRGEHRFEGLRADPTTGGRLRVVTRLQSATRVGTGVQLRVFDRDFNVPSAMSVAETGSVEDDADDDGVECQQEGEHEGENEGC